MRLLLTSQYFWPENFPINDVVAALVANGVEVTVLTGKPNYPEGEFHAGYRGFGSRRETYRGAEVLRVPMLARGEGSKARLVLNYLSFIFSASFFGSRQLQGKSFDAVLVYGVSPLLQALPAILFSTRFRIPLAVWVQDLWPESLSATGHVKNRFLLRAVGMFVRMIYKRSDLILVQSEAFRKPVAALCEAEKSIEYLPNSVNPVQSQVKTLASANLLAKLSDGFNVVFAGNLGTAQGLDTILDAAEYLLGRCNAKIILAGSGSQENWVADECRRRSLSNVHFAGRFPPSEMEAILKSAQALLVSLKPEPIFSLTVPSKVQAYLWSGQPIIAALDGEAAKVIEDAGAGLCSLPGDSEALARNIIQLADLPESDRQAMGMAGRTYFDKNFAPELLTDKLISLLAGLKKNKESQS